MAELFLLAVTNYPQTTASSTVPLNESALAGTLCCLHDGIAVLCLCVYMCTCVCVYVCAVPVGVLHVYQLMKHS